MIHSVACFPFSSTPAASFLAVLILLLLVVVVVHFGSHHHQLVRPISVLVLMVDHVGPMLLLLQIVAALRTSN